MTSQLTQAIWATCWRFWKNVSPKMQLYYHKHVIYFINNWFICSPRIILLVNVANLLSVFRFSAQKVYKQDTRAFGTCMMERNNIETKEYGMGYVKLKPLNLYHTGTYDVVFIARWSDCTRWFISWVKLRGLKLGDLNSNLVSVDIWSLRLNANV